MRASRLELSVVRDNRRDLATAGENNRGIEVDRIQRANLDGVQPRCPVEDRAIDVDQADLVEHAFSRLLEALSPREPAQLDNQQRARPPSVVRGQRVADDLRVGLTE